jgi:SIR2-like domain
MADRPKINHNVYILGAGFSFDGGIPLVKDFLERMGDSLEWLYAHDRTTEAEAVQEVFSFKLRAAGAAYRAQINIEDIEELFSLASASEGGIRANEITTAIAATIDFARTTAKPSKCRVVKKKIINASGTWQQEEKEFSTYNLYAGLISEALCQRTSDSRNTVITFNYDTLLEDGLSEQGIPFNYGLLPDTADYHPSSNFTVGEMVSPEALQILKLHGSVNWSPGTKPNERIKIYSSYNDIREVRDEVLLIPPTWRKVFGGHLTDVWEKAVQALNSATRVIVIGFSMPSTDTHFKYLLAAGLQNNISLRKFLFINPGLRSEQEGNKLKGNLFSILRKELEERGIVQLKEFYTHELLLSNKNLALINRQYSEEYLEIHFSSSARIHIYHQ